MKLAFGLLTLALISITNMSAQERTQFSKEGSISSGYGYANGIEGAKSGSSFFLQMSYRMSMQFSLGMEFEHLDYKLPGYIPVPSINPNVQNLFDNNFSLLIKYHLPLHSKVQVAVASGWTYYTRQWEYYDFYRDTTSQSITRRVTSFSDYGIPFLLETNYPLWKNLGAGIRVKYNFNPTDGSTYSAGVGVSLRL